MDGAAPKEVLTPPETPAAPPAPPRPAVVYKLRLPPRRRGLLRKVAKTVLFLVIGGVQALAIAGFVAYAYFSQGLPSIPTPQSYLPPVLSEFWSDDGALGAEFFQERRKLVPYERIPKRLIQAFIAAEDQHFFDHFGVDPTGVARAAMNMLRGKHTQGGSTLTQQTAKAVLVSAELKQIDEDEMMAEADRRVPPVPEPAAEAMKSEMAVVRKERKDHLLAKYAGRQLDPEELEKVMKVSESEVREEAHNRLMRVAETERQGAVKVAFIKVREEREGSAVRQATVRKGLRAVVRKIREAILARRLEKSLTKEQILYLYLNNVNLGHGAYGVEAAAENYFRKDVGELTLGEMALLAGLPQAPSKNPYAAPDEAKVRREYVLHRMVEEKMVTAAEANAAAAEPIKTYDVEDVFRDTEPFYTEQVRRDIAARYGTGRLYKDGLRVEMAMDAERQREAQVAMLRGLIWVDKRQGYVGPLAHLKMPQERIRFNDAIASELSRNEPRAGEYYAGTVENIDEQGNYAEVQVGHTKLKLPIMGMRWARKPDPIRDYRIGLIEHVSQALKVGDVILVKAVVKPEWDEAQSNKAELIKKLPTDPLMLQLEQSPTLQGALISIDPFKKYVVAMIGGYDFDASEYNRAFQACRQPGSSFKPVVYSAAFEKLPDYTPVKHVIDSPAIFNDPVNQVRWKPQNYDEDFKGDVLLRDALINSWNVPAVKTADAVGIKDLVAWAKKLGYSRPMNEDLSIALGSSCVIPWEHAQVYAMFNQDGKRVKPVFIRKVEDRFGRTLEDNTAYDDAWAPLADRIAGGYAKLFDHPVQLMTPETAFLTKYLMHEVVLYGTGTAAQRIGKPAAGKTGTTNDSFDAWFMGFTYDLVTGVWVGYDRYEHPLGKYENGGRAALPIWVDYMKQALSGRPEPEFTPPQGAEVVKVKIDPRTGDLAKPGDRSAVEEWFKKDTEPKETSGTKSIQQDFFLQDQQ
jgi:penicillin-binding protein 1A